MCMRIVRGTIFGGIANFFLGWLIYGILLMDFMSANSNQCAVRPNGEMIWWGLIAANLITALLLTLVLKWSGAKSVTGGLKTGALVGLLYGFAVDLGFWSMMDWYSSFWVIPADVLANTVMWGLTGMVIVLLWGKEKAA